MAAATGASLRELMERMGHSSSRAAMIYQHASRDRDEALRPPWDQLCLRHERVPADRKRACNGHAAGTRLRDLVPVVVSDGSDLGFRVGAGEGNRTLMTSLEGWGSAIELRPRDCHP
jgi:hypothetical protein